MNNLRGAHLAVGLLGFIAFLLTGQYMALVFAHQQPMPDAPRLMFRSAHIYTLYGALLNLLLCAYLRPLVGLLARRLQLVGSIIVMVVPVLLLVSFHAESRNNSLGRPLCVAGIFLSLLGVALHLFAARANREGRGA